MATFTSLANTKIIPSEAIYSHPIELYEWLTSANFVQLLHYILHGLLTIIYILPWCLSPGQTSIPGWLAKQARLRSEGGPAGILELRS